MSWLKNTVRRWLNDNDESTQSKLSSDFTLGSNTIRVDEDRLNSEAVLNFKVYSAVGGKIVEFRRYDRHRDRSDCQTYIITNDQDFGERIAKIATMENLKS